ncbi:glyoxalase superfamily protein [Portibacter marinus]|uniref:glyoxalase superfamily protein n=1 Tax=Portibacter marinus TaxID=2898660 RepID=UPI001F16EF24|nr:glyoxalase superfamily protein [Portibacter marinus]
MLLSHQASVFPCIDMQLTLDFYHDKLGFIPSYLHGNPITYAVLKREGITINLNLTSEFLEKSTIYIFCHNVKEVYNEYTKKEVSFFETLNTTDYGMQEFVVLDPNQNKLIFGQHT